MIDRRATLLLSAGHLATDMNQGALPALLPFLIAAHGLTYQQAAGLVFAATIASSIVQPLFGRYADRFQAAWLMPVGILAAGVGLALTGVVGNYYVMAVVLMVSGLGVAAFHPEAARSMNAAAGQRKATGMSFFSTGGTAGYALGPLLATSAVLGLGLRGALLLAVPAVVVAGLLFSQLRVLPRLAVRPAHAAAGPAVPGAVDDWGLFGRLSAAIIFRSVVFFGINIFLPLYWIHVLGQSAASAGTILSVWLGAGLLGALVGGRLCDHYGAERVGLLTSLATAPLLLVLVVFQQPWIAALTVVLMSILTTLPGSGLMVLGQSYLPNHIGVASGVTIGLSVSVGGAIAPVLGWMADQFGIPWALASLSVVPVIIALFILSLPHQRLPALQHENRVD